MSQIRMSRALMPIPQFVDMGVPPSPDELVEWLNERRIPGRKRVETLLRAFQEAEVRKSAFFESVSAQIPAGKMRDDPVLMLHGRINRILKRYKVFPQLGPLAAGLWPALWMPVGVGRMNIPPLKRAKAANDLAETNAILALVMLARLNRLHRVRKCANSPACRKWFFAKPSHRRYCSTTCQQQHFRSTDEFKTKRREWMRDYRLRFG